MVPILFAPNATSFTTNGVGRLSDCISCKVIEELNGQYELELTYPKDGKHFSSIQYSSIIVAKPFQNGTHQAFRVYKISKPMMGEVTVYARHISYQLNYIPCSPFSGQTASAVLSNISTAVAENCPFTFYTDIIGNRTSLSLNLWGNDQVVSGILEARFDTTINKLVSDDAALTIWIKCDKSKKYQISKKRGYCFTIGTTVVRPTVDSTLNAVWSNASVTKTEYTTVSNAEYLVVYIYRQILDGASEIENFVNSVSIRSIGTYTWMLYEPKCIRSFLLGKDDDSIQTIYGGEYEWDNYSVKLWEHRGTNKGVVIRYGKNLIDLKQEENIENTITGIYPIWKSEGTVVSLTEKVVHASNASNFPFYRTVIQDFTSDFDQMPTEDELREMAHLYIQQEGIGIPDINLTVNFANLSETMEYSGIGGLQTVNLGDTVKVEFPDLGVSAEQKVTKTEYDTLNERYLSVTIGNIEKSIDTTIEDQMNQLSEKVSQEDAQNRIDRATGVMNAGTRGHVIIGRNEQGFANEIYFLDNANVALAKNVLRVNVNGIGFSSNGLRGPYAQAWTLDGHLSLGGINNANGTLEILDASGNSIGQWDNTGLFVNTGKILAGQFSSRNGEFYVLENGDDPPKVEVGWSGWDIWNNCMKSNWMGWDSNGYLNPASDDSASAAINGGCDSDTCSSDTSGTGGYPGTAGFKAIWIDDEWFEGGSSPWSYRGRGSSDHHLWDVAETLKWLDSRITTIDNQISSLDDRVTALEHSGPICAPDNQCSGDCQNYDWECPSEESCECNEITDIS